MGGCFTTIQACLCAYELKKVEFRITHETVAKRRASAKIDLPVAIPATWAFLDIDLFAT
jgi:hypothetical protein